MTTPTTTPTTTTSRKATTARSARRGALRRVRGLARANVLLLLRNRLTMSYALVFPLLPLVLLVVGPRGDTTIGPVAAGLTLAFAMLFPVYYNLLSIIVSRRDELVLKRLRIGETRDGELLVAMALPGVAIAVVLALLTVVLGVALGQPLPRNPALYAVAVLLTAATFAALAVWTAAWTRNAEAAQLTSLPVITVTMLGAQVSTLPGALARFVDLTPGAALDRLLRLAWFGQGPDGSVTLATSWAAGVLPVLVLVLWTGLALELARRSMRWEPRA